MSREILSPPLQRMGPNRNYRVNVIHPYFGGNPVQHQQLKDKSYVEQDLYGEDDDEDDMTDCTIEELPNGAYKLTMHVAQSFYGGLIGFKGQTKRRIETETRTEIYIPRSQVNAVGKKDENIVIKGQNRSSVCAARRNIKLLLHSLRKRMRATHFVGVALNFGEIREKFVDFKKRILDAKIPGIEEELFQPEARIHITLAVCVLLDDVERAKGIELLQKSRDYLNDRSKPFNVKVAGLEIMNDDPSAVRVVYARVDAPELQKYADCLLNGFLRSGLGLDEFGRQNVKMHMTVLNSKFLKKINPNASDNFDAREILKQYGEFDFGSALVSEIELFIRGTYVEDGENRGFYKASSKLNIKLC